MKTCSAFFLFVFSLTVISCGETPTDVGATGFALNEDATIPDSGCSNGNCPPIPDSGCSNGNCPPVPDSGCSNGNCPQLDGGEEPPGPVCCVPVANMTQHLCCGLFGDVISCRLSTIPDHQVLHDALLEPQQACKHKIKCKKVKRCFAKNKKVCVKVKVCKLEKECETVYCAPDWFPAEAFDPVFPPSAQCDFWDAIVDCPKKCKWKKWLWWLLKKEKKLTCD